jgi:hypothetical protein
VWPRLAQLWGGTERWRYSCGGALIRTAVLFMQLENRTADPKTWVFCLARLQAVNCRLGHTTDLFGELFLCETSGNKVIDGELDIHNAYLIRFRIGCQYGFEYHAPRWTIQK